MYVCRYVCRYKSRVELEQSYVEHKLCTPYSLLPTLLYPSLAHACGVLFGGNAPPPPPGRCVCVRACVRVCMRAVCDGMVWYGMVWLVMVMVMVVMMLLPLGCC